MMAYVVNDGRLLALKPSEWFLMLAGVALTGFLALLIWSSAERDRRSVRSRWPINLSGYRWCGMTATTRIITKTSHFVP